MKRLAHVLSIGALGLTIVPSLLVFAQLISWQTHANIMLAGTALWFATAGWWVKPDPRDSTVALPERGAGRRRKEDTDVR